MGPTCGPCDLHMLLPMKPRYLNGLDSSAACGPWGRGNLDNPSGSHSNAYEPNKLDSGHVKCYERRRMPRGRVLDLGTGCGALWIRRTGPWAIVPWRGWHRDWCTHRLNPWILCGFGVQCFVRSVIFGVFFALFAVFNLLVFNLHWTDSEFFASLHFTSRTNGPVRLANPKGEAAPEH